MTKLIALAKLTDVDDILIIIIILLYKLVRGLDSDFLGFLAKNKVKGYIVDIILFIIVLSSYKVQQLNSSNKQIARRTVKKFQLI